MGMGSEAPIAGVAAVGLLFEGPGDGERGGVVSRLLLAVCAPLLGAHGGREYLCRTNSERSESPLLPFDTQCLCAHQLAPTTAKEIQPTKLIFAPHFYDLHTLFSQSVSNVTFNVQALSRGAPIWEGIFFGRQGMKKKYVPYSRPASQALTQVLQLRSSSNQHRRAGVSFSRRGPHHYRRDWDSVRYQPTICFQGRELEVAGATNGCDLFCDGLRSRWIQVSHFSLTLSRIRIEQS